MLQIIFFIIILLFSSNSFAQTYQQGQVPAFLQNEASQNPVQQTGSSPAFLQKEQEEQLYMQQLQLQQQQQNQYNYQSADPNNSSGAVTLPPAAYQPAPGDTPAFVIQEQNQAGQPPAAAEQSTLKTNQKEDIIQINFSDEQYKPEQDEVTPLNTEQATQYNTEIQQSGQVEAAPTTELQEGARFEGEKPQTTQQNEQTKQQQLQAKEKQVTENAIPEPEKTTTNMLRIQYSKEAIELAEKDKKTLLSTVILLKQNKQQKILIKSYTSSRDSGADARRIGLMRVISIRDYLMKQGIDFSRTEVKVMEPGLNKEDLDYIDIDKI